MATRMEVKRVTTVKAPDCLKCVHFFHSNSGLVCKAFPNGIPEPIYMSQVKHTTPYKGDNGILFSLDVIKEAEEQIFIARVRRLEGLED